MKKFFKFAAMAAIAAVIASCGKEPAPEPTPGPGPDNGGTTTTTPEYTENLTFTLAVTEVEADKAKIKVEHNGTTKDTWYGFATTETDVQKAIEAVLAEGNVTLKKNVNTTVTVRSLEPETDYTFIAVGITADGKTYGEPASVEFTTPAVQVTPPAPEGFTVNPAWTVEYLGAYQGYDHVGAVNSTDSNPYFITAWPTSLYEEYGIEAIAQAEIDSWLEYLATRPQNTFADVLSYESSAAVLSIDAGYGTEWVVLAIGATPDATATGLYAYTEIDLSNLGGGDDDTELTAEYADWIGNWTFTGANGVSIPITFEKGVANKSYIMTGWEGFGDLPVEVQWDAENQIWGAMIQNIGTFEFQGGETGDIWFVAYDEEGYFYPVEDIPAFIGGFDSDGNRLAVGYEPEGQDGQPIPFVLAGYVVDFGEDQWGYLTDPAQLPTFPITITPATKATSCGAKDFMTAKKAHMSSLLPKVVTNTVTGKARTL